MISKPVFSNEIENSENLVLLLLPYSIPEQSQADPAKSASAGNDTKDRVELASITPFRCALQTVFTRKNLPLEFKAAGLLRARITGEQYAYRTTSRTTPSGAVQTSIPRS